MTDGTTTLNFTYDADGLRQQKQVGTTTYNYVYNGSSLVQMTDGTNTLKFIYDASRPVGLVWNGTNYYYLTNAQGDILGIANGSGTLVVQYAYDVWGKLLSVTGSMANTLGNLNPLRYRGYVYDNETGLYYLQSRYYKPEWGRFVNADGLVQAVGNINGKNLFAYCNNNPVSRSDPSGEFGIFALALAVVAVAFFTTGCEVKPTDVNYNCYAYAMKIGVEVKAKHTPVDSIYPGDFGHDPLTDSAIASPSSLHRKTAYEDAIRADCEKFGYSFTPVSSGAYCPAEGKWLIAAVACTIERTDFHFYLKDEDGSWSHKRGTLPDCNTDASGNIIWDPATCDRDYSGENDGPIYNEFIGYYEVGPIN